MNATQAAIRAGYSKKTAYSIGCENLTKPEIQKYIDEQLEKIENAKIADAAEVMRYLTSVLRGESESEEIVTELVGDGCSKAFVILKKPSEKDKLKSAELLGKRYSLYSDKVELDTDTELHIHVDYGDE